MRRLNLKAGRNGTAFAAAAAFAFPPITGADIDDDWNDSKIGAIPEFDIEFASDNTTAITVAELLSAHTASQVIVDDNVDTVDFANNELDLTGHSYLSGDGPLRLTTTDTLPTGLALATDYWAIYVGANSIQLATSRANALAGVAVAFSDVGAGTHTISDTADTERLVWTSHGLLGQAGDGSISVTATKAFVQRLGHRPRAVAYGMVATIDAGNVTVTMYPITNID